jgi:hypothetical protein
MIAGIRRAPVGEHADQSAGGDITGRVGLADEVATAVSWLCSPGVRFGLVVALPVDGRFAAH